jgi:hypothetical protein
MKGRIASCYFRPDTCERAPRRPVVGRAGRDPRSPGALRVCVSVYGLDIRGYRLAESARRAARRVRGAVRNSVGDLGPLDINQREQVKARQRYGPTVSIGGLPAQHVDGSDWQRSRWV